MTTKETKKFRRKNEMKKTIIAAVAMSLMTFAAPATARPITYVESAQLFQMCKQEEGSLDGQACMGYIVAVADIMDETTVHGWSACIEADTTIRQLKKVVTIWYKNNPEDLEEWTAHSTVARALAEAYPCGTPS